MCDLQILAREVKALRRQLETEKQQAAAKEAEHSAREVAKEAELTAREAEFAAKETAFAAAPAAAQAVDSSARGDMGSSEVARPGDIDKVESEVYKQAEAAVAVTSASDVVEAVEHEAGKEARGVLASDAHGDVGGGGDESSHAAALDTAAASDTGATVQVPVSYKQLLQEVAALRQRLHDSSFEVVAGILVLYAVFQLLIALLASC